MEEPRCVVEVVGYQSIPGLDRVDEARSTTRKALLQRKSPPPSHLRGEKRGCFMSKVGGVAGRTVKISLIRGYVDAGSYSIKELLSGRKVPGEWEGGVLGGNSVGP